MLQLAHVIMPRNKQTMEQIMAGNRIALFITLTSLNLHELGEYWQDHHRPSAKPQHDLVDTVCTLAHIRIHPASTSITSAVA